MVHVRRGSRRGFLVFGKKSELKLVSHIAVLVPRGWRLPPNVAEPNNLSLPFHRSSVSPILFLPSSSIRTPPHNMDTFNASSAETDSPITPYEYEPIDDPKGKIRILILLPPASSDDPELRCSLTTPKIQTVHHTRLSLIAGGLKR
jgi:hypothetical protein